jgi:hypothetical protein
LELNEFVEFIEFIWFYIGSRDKAEETTLDFILMSNTTNTTKFKYYKNHPAPFLTRKLEIKKDTLFLKQILHVKTHVSRFLDFLFNTSDYCGDKVMIIHRPLPAP